MDGSPLNSGINAIQLTSGGSGSSRAEIQGRGAELSKISRRQSSREEGRAERPQKEHEERTADVCAGVWHFQETVISRARTTADVW